MNKDAVTGWNAFTSILNFPARTATFLFDERKISIELDQGMSRRVLTIDHCHPCPESNALVLRVTDLGKNGMYSEPLTKPLPIASKAKRRDILDQAQAERRAAKTEHDAAEDALRRLEIAQTLEKWRLDLEDAVSTLSA